MMAKTVAADVVAAIGERLPSSCGEERRLSVEEAGRIGSDALIMVDPEQKLGLTARAELVGRYVLTAATVRAVSPVYRSSAPQYEYWPFGQDGGFCNPIKLKMLDD
ncbi:hypothetical protein [Ralstonia pseudosolanacearum]|uniref:hypothetical protein n=1 Tax=Ralstonia pseudosolanacearum TaxID=1310165 RepID=UPI003CEC2416